MANGRTAKLQKGVTPFKDILRRAAILGDGAQDHLDLTNDPEDYFKVGIEPASGSTPLSLGILPVMELDTGVYHYTAREGWGTIVFLHLYPSRSH